MLFTNDIQVYMDGMFKFSPDLFHTVLSHNPEMYDLD